MAMERWNPFQELEAGIDRYLGARFPAHFFGNLPSESVVAIDLHETETGYELTASLPGVKPENLDIALSSNSVRLKGKMTESHQRQENNYIWRERRSGSFQRTVLLPQAIDIANANASLEHGVLKLILPHLSNAESRRIAVNGIVNSSSEPETKKIAARPAVLEGLTTSQLGSLEEHVNAGDKDGFHRVAHSYGWDESSTVQTWDFMNHSIKAKEVQKAFKE